MADNLTSMRPVLRDVYNERNEQLPTRSLAGRLRCKSKPRANALDGGAQIPSHSFTGRLRLSFTASHKATLAKKNDVLSMSASTTASGRYQQGLSSTAETAQLEKDCKAVAGEELHLSPEEQLGMDRGALALALKMRLDMKDQMRDRRVRWTSTKGTFLHSEAMDWLTLQVPDHDTEINYKANRCYVSQRYRTELKEWKAAAIGNRLLDAGYLSSVNGIFRFQAHRQDGNSRKKYLFRFRDSVIDRDSDRLNEFIMNSSSTKTKRKSKRGSSILGKQQLQPPQEQGRNTRDSQHTAQTAESAVNDDDVQDDSSMRDASASTASSPRAPHVITKPLKSIVRPERPPPVVKSILRSPSSSPDQSPSTPSRSCSFADDCHPSERDRLIGDPFAANRPAAPPSHKGVELVVVE